MTQADGLTQYIAKVFRRYSRGPETRDVSARHLMTAAINLYADHTSPAEAALIAAEVVADLAQRERAEGSR